MSEARVEDRFTAVRTVSRALRAAGVAHALGGSALRWSLGLERRVRDWDLTTDADRDAVEAALASLGPVRVRPAGRFRSAYLFRLRLAGETVEVIGGFAVETPAGVERIATRISGWAHGVPLADASDWARAYRALGRDAHAEQLERFVAAVSAGTLATAGPPGPAGLPDVLAWPDGRRVTDAAAWPERASAWLRTLSEALYGDLPPPPTRLDVAVGAEAPVSRLPGPPTVTTFRLHAVLGRHTLRLGVQVLRPAGDGPFPVLVDGDAGWWAPDEGAVRALLERGVAVARFDRTEVAFDDPRLRDPRPRGPLPEALESDDAGAIAYWAWAFARVLDLLERLPWVDRGRLALSGFSRGGKAALLAAAWDARAALVHAHASGAGGAAASRVVPEGAESLAQVVARFPAWFARNAGSVAGAPAALAFDQHALLAALAPRRVVLTCGLGDAWANPAGTAVSVAAARPAFALFAAEHALVWRVRPGGHALERSDWDLAAETLVAP